MADKKTSLIVRMTDDLNGVKSKSVVNVNPDATLAELKTFAQGLAGLTDHSYVSSTKVEQTDTDYSKEPYEYPFAKVTFSILVGNDLVPILSEEDATIVGNYHNGYAFHFLNVDNTQGITHENGTYNFVILWDAAYVSTSTDNYSSVAAATSGITLFNMDVDTIEGVTFSHGGATNVRGQLQVSIPDTFTQTLTPETSARDLMNSLTARCARLHVCGQEGRSYCWAADFFPYHGGTN